MMLGSGSLNKADWTDKGGLTKATVKSLSTSSDELNGHYLSLFAAVKAGLVANTLENDSLVVSASKYYDTRLSTL